MKNIPTQYFTNLSSLTWKLFAIKWWTKTEKIKSRNLDNMSSFLYVLNVIIYEIVIIYEMWLYVKIYLFIYRSERL